MYLSQIQLSGLLEGIDYWFWMGIVCRLWQWKRGLFHYICLFIPPIFFSHWMHPFHISSIYMVMLRTKPHQPHMTMRNDKAEPIGWRNIRGIRGSTAKRYCRNIAVLTYIYWWGLKGLIALFGRIVGPIRRSHRWRHICHGVLRERTIEHSDTHILVYTFITSVLPMRVI